MFKNGEKYACSPPSSLFTHDCGFMQFFFSMIILLFQTIQELFFLQPKIDKDSLESLSMECPRIIVNPKPSLFGHKRIDIPKHALPGVPLDDFVVEDIDPKTWLVPGSRIRTIQHVLSSIELPIAERFRLAFVERDARMAPKRAKNARQRQQRAAREWLTTSTSAKSVVLASQMSKNLHI